MGSSFFSLYRKYLCHALSPVYVRKIRAEIKHNMIGSIYPGIAVIEDEYGLNESFEYLLLNFRYSGLLFPHYLVSHIAADTTRHRMNDFQLCMLKGCDGYAFNLVFMLI